MAQQEHPLHHSRLITPATLLTAMDYSFKMALQGLLCNRVGNTFTVISDEEGSFTTSLTIGATLKQVRFLCDIDDEERQKSWWSIEENGQILFNNEYPFFENHSLRIAYIYGERYVDKSIEDACTKLVVMDILMSDDYSVFPEGTQNVDLVSKHQKLEAEVAKLLVPFQESIVVAGMRLIKWLRKHHKGNNYHR